MPAVQPKNNPARAPGWRSIGLDVRPVGPLLENTVVACAMDVVETVVLSDILLVGEVLAPPKALLELQLLVIESADGNVIVLEVDRVARSQFHLDWLLTSSSMSCRNSDWQLS